jgi:hypothetical protein
LFEDELLDVRLDAGRSTVGLIIGAGEVVRVLVAFKVRATSWDVTGHDVPGFGQRYCRLIWTSTWTSTPGGLLRLTLRVQGDSTHHVFPARACNIDLSITAAEFASYELHVDGFAEARPDYIDLDAAIHLQRPDWSSHCRILGWSRRSA